MILSKYPESAAAIAIWLAAAAYLVLVVGFAWNPTPFAQGLAATGIAAAFVHASFTYGLKHALALFIACVAVTFAMENLGAATGFPFGHYHFRVAPDLPHIGAIPMVVGPLWFGMGYFSWTVAGILLGGADFRLRERSNDIVLPVVAAFVMTQWDLILEPPSATVSKAWVWHDGGAFFGVPASNFFGWLLTSWLFFQVFALYLRGRGDALARAAGLSPAFRAMAVFFYLSSGLTHLTPWLIGQVGEAVDGAGHIWRVQDVRETAVVTMLLTMGFTSLLALLRIFRPG
ncbi:MAG: carotenoid biosynthesis protein [Bradyrhizobiaceae bacterium]|nr:carotenoid biosynthesis protein [Bradyrhizobiaceae bacterium]